MFIIYTKYIYTYIYIKSYDFNNINIFIYSYIYILNIFLQKKKFRKDIKFNESRELDVYYNKDEVNTLKPVVIHIYGGTWKKGNYLKKKKIKNKKQYKNVFMVLNIKI